MRQSEKWFKKRCFLTPKSIVAGGLVNRSLTCQKLTAEKGYRSSRCKFIQSSFNL